MAIEVDNSYRAVGLVDAPQQREGDRMVTTEGDDTRQSVPSPRRAGLLGVGERLAHKQAVVTLLNLSDGPSVVIPYHGTRD